MVTSLERRLSEQISLKMLNSYSYLDSIWIIIYLKTNIKENVKLGWQSCSEVSTSKFLKWNLKISFYSFEWCYFAVMLVKVILVGHNTQHGNGSTIYLLLYAQYQSSFYIFVWLKDPSSTLVWALTVAMATVSWGGGRVIH